MELKVFTGHLIITLAGNVFKVEYIIADIMTVLYAESKNHTHFF